MSSPSALPKVNHLVMRYLHFESVRGDLQEGNASAARCRLPLFPVPITVFSSTKSGFLCAFACQNPRFQAFRAQNRGFCALLGSGTIVFGLFEHKIGIFVRFWPSGPSFSGVSLLLEEHFRVMEQFDSTFVVAHVLRIYDTAYCLKLHCGVCGH